MVRIIESVNDNYLYHSTDIEHAIQILESNTLKAISSDYEKEDHVPSISFTRDKNFLPVDVLTVQFVLDRKKLTNNYKIELIDDFKNTKLKRKQSEEYITRNITNLNKYIIEVRVDEYYKKKFSKFENKFNIIYFNTIEEE